MCSSPHREGRESSISELRGEWSVSRFGLFTLRKRAKATHEVQKLVISRVLLHRVTMAWKHPIAPSKNQIRPFSLHVAPLSHHRSQQNVWLHSGMTKFQAIQVETGGRLEQLSLHKATALASRPRHNKNFSTSMRNHEQTRDRRMTWTSCQPTQKGWGVWRVVRRNGKDAASSRRTSWKYYFSIHLKWRMHRKSSEHLVPRSIFRRLIHNVLL
jgi:hypothetical protein